MQTFSLYVRDMSCSGCSNAVKQRLEMLPDVYHVNVDIIEGSATVYYRESNELLYEIQHLVDEFGYLGRSELVPDHQCLHDKNIIVKNSNKVATSPVFTYIQPPFDTEDFKLADIAKEAADLLKRLFSGVDGNIKLRLWNNATLQLGNATHQTMDHTFTLVCNSANAVRTMVLGRDPLRFADAYFKNHIDIEGNFFDALQLKDHLHMIRMSMRDKLSTIFSAFKLPSATADTTHQHHQAIIANSVKDHSQTENLEAIAFHYNISNEFYALWLDQSMIYSCAYFEHPDNTLEQAQLAKLEHICHKLMLKPGDKLLDIGCGWGALIIHAAKYYGVTAHGITLSKSQFDLAKARIVESNLQHLVSVELRDYRELKGKAVYDKISSIGMFEHIGLKNLPLYFATVHRLLKLDGLFLNHGITHYQEGWKKTLSTEFINRYVFPDGQLDTVSNIQKHMEHAKFEIADVEALRSHYALTLRHWVARLEAHHEQALKYVSEATYRIWRLYMAACALEFESGEIGVYQVLATKTTNGVNVLPLTRSYMYPPVEQSQRHEYLTRKAHLI